MSNQDYAKKQSAIILSAQSPRVKEDAGWRLLSHLDEPGLAPDGTLTPEQMAKAERIAKDA